ncbi:hypothetical protein ACFX15_008885 [Malus domestica]
MGSGSVTEYKNFLSNCRSFCNSGVMKVANKAVAEDISVGDALIGFVVGVVFGGLDSGDNALPCLRRTYLLRAEALQTAHSSIQLQTTWSGFSPLSTAEGRHVVHLLPAKQTAWVAVPTRKATGAFGLTDVGTPAVTCRSARSTAKLRRPIPFVSDVKETQDPEDALSLFHEYHQMGFKHDYPSYSALLYKLARRRNFEAVDAVLSLVRDRNIHYKDTLSLLCFNITGKPIW